MSGSRPAPVTPSPCCGPTPITQPCAKARSRVTPTRKCSGRTPQSCCARHSAPASTCAPRATPAAISVIICDAARAAPPASVLGRDATQYGVRPGSPDDQTRALQRAIDEAARAQVPLALPPGIYRTGLLRLSSGSQLIGVRGATKLVFTGGASMFSGEGASSIGLANITLDGGGIPLPTRRGLVHCIAGRDIRITDCEIANSGGNGIW